MDYGQIIPKTTHTQDKSYPGKPVPKTTRTQDSPYLGQIITKNQNEPYFNFFSWPNQNDVKIVWLWFLGFNYHFIKNNFVILLSHYGRLSINAIYYRGLDALTMDLYIGF